MILKDDALKILSKRSTRVVCTLRLTTWRLRVLRQPRLPSRVCHSRGSQTITRAQATPGIAGAHAKTMRYVCCAVARSWAAERPKVENGLPNGLCNPIHSPA